MSVENPVPTGKSVLFTDKGDGWLYTGPLGEALTFAMTDRRLHITHRRGAQAPWLAELCDCEPETHVVGAVGYCPFGAEFGAGPNLETALRYVLGAYFGPIDSEYEGDEALCRLLGVSHG